jgi:Family of unknown function (DUF6191)
VSIFFDLFNPNNRHRTEELRRLENTREEEAQGEPGRGPIDLKSGMVVIRPPAKKPQAEQPEAAAAAESDAVVEDAVVVEGAAGDDADADDEDAAAPEKGDDGA